VVGTRRRSRPRCRAQRRPHGRAGGCIGGGPRCGRGAGTFSGRTRGARPALINGLAGVVWAPGGQPRVVFSVTVAEGRIVAIDLLGDPERLAELDRVVLDE
jgi:hypothetical protein